MELSRESHDRSTGSFIESIPSGIVYWEAAVQSGDYRDINLTIRGGSIHAGAVFGGTEAPLGTIRIENVTPITRGHAFSFEDSGDTGHRGGNP